MYTALRLERLKHFTVCLHGCAIAFALKQTFAQCAFFSRGNTGPDFQYFRKPALCCELHPNSEKQGATKCC